ncbi:Acyl-coenzyme A oxidase 2 [Chlorella sorokiniana]|uniref:Acyl-coenzyme A oxidase 2 n=1 Tax=Chlorella sorokiniana TaxID=3076 RepID=A0A2P6TI57_CHLSO|nr:Acyl-coenzyme A oxidase 2 [Chlorella sorokiniana]|eukprot:PRW33983.1 Acyl-coenzyme A oxidase 2 [Chlorella sorokiniana]
MAAAGDPQPPAAAGTAQQASPDTAAAQERERRKRTSFHHYVVSREPVTDRLLRWLPEFVRDLVQDRRRQLLYMERQLQRRLVNEFRSQVRELEPVLHMRGRLVGETILESFMGESETNVTYGEAVASSLKNTPAANRIPVQELAAVVDPLVTPFIDPFVEGLKAPINEEVGKIKKKVVHSFAVTGAACFATGLVLGWFLPRGDGGKGGGGRGR